MTEEEMKVFIKDTIFYIEEGILDKVCKLPEDWEGLELKWFIEDNFKTSFRVNPNFKRELKRYKNDILVNNLL